MWPAIAGLLVTGVGLPLLGVAAIGITRSDGLLALSQKVSRPYGLCFTCALYLTIGPFFAIPRCVTVPFTLGVEPLVGAEHSGLALALFSLVFFTIVAAFSLRPASILTSIGRTLTPLFLLFFGVLAVTVLARPRRLPPTRAPWGTTAPPPSSPASWRDTTPWTRWPDWPLASVVVNVIRGAGVTRPEDVAISTVRSGLFSCLIMAGIYIVVTLMGVQSRAIPADAANGGEVLSLLANRHYGTAGTLILAATVTLACLKTSVGAGDQLRGNLCGNVSQGTRLQGLGAAFQRSFLPDRQCRADGHSGLVAAGADAALSPGHHADSAGSRWKMVSARSAGLPAGHGADAGGRAL